MHSLLPIIVNCSIIYFDFSRRSAFLAFSVATLLIFSIPHCFSSFLNDTISENTLLFVSFHATLFFMIYGGIRLMLFKYLFKVKKEIGFGSERGIVVQYYYSLIMLVLFVIAILISFNFQVHELLFATWSDIRSNNSIFMLLGVFCFHAGSGFLLLAFVSKKWISVCLSVLLIVTVAMVLKTRSYVIAFLFPLIFYYLLYIKLNAKKFLLLCLISVVFFSLYSGARIFRHLGSLEQIFSYANDFEIIADRGEFQLIETLYFFVEKGGVVGGDNDNSTLFRILLLPIPSSFLTFDKPKELSQKLWDEKTNIFGVSGALHATVVGDSILSAMNYGSLLYGFIYGLLFTFLEYFFINSIRLKFIYFSLIITFCFYIARGAIYNGIVNLIVAGGLIYSFSICMRLKFPK